MSGIGQDIMEPTANGHASTVVSAFTEAAPVQNGTGQVTPIVATHVESTPASPPRDDSLYRLVVMVLGAVVIIALIGALMVTMAGKGRQVPEVVVALGSGAVGALAGLISPSSGGRQ